MVEGRVQEGWGHELLVAVGSEPGAGDSGHDENDLDCEPEHELLVAHGEVHKLEAAPARVTGAARGLGRPTCNRGDGLGLPVSWPARPLSGQGGLPWLLLSQAHACAPFLLRRGPRGRE